MRKLKEDEIVGITAKADLFSLLHPGSVFIIMEDVVVDC